MKRFFVNSAATFCVGLTACTTTGVIKKEEVSLAQTVEQFVERQFRAFELPSIPFTQQQPKPKLASGEALYDAYFTNANPSQLALPARNLKVFCEAQGGSFSQIEASRISASKLATPEMTSSDVFYGVRATYREMGAEPQLANLTAAYEAHFYQRFVDAYYPQRVRDTLSSMQRGGAFGKYGCKRADQPLWVAAIEPTQFTPSSDPQNLLLTASMTLYIKAVTLKKQ